MCIKMHWEYNLGRSLWNKLRIEIKIKKKCIFIEKVPQPLPYIKFSYSVTKLQKEYVPQQLKMFSQHEAHDNFGQLCACHCPSFFVVVSFLAAFCPLVMCSSTQPLSLHLVHEHWLIIYSSHFFPTECTKPPLLHFPPFRLIFHRF